MRTGAVAGLADEPQRDRRLAGRSWIRSSVERMTREISDVTMIVAMNHDAILMPSGRS